LLKKLDFPIHSLAVTYATKQLTQALQDLTSRSQQVETKPRNAIPQVISTDRLQFSKEVEYFLEQKQAYSQKTRHVSVGSY